MRAYTHPLAQVVKGGLATLHLASQISKMSLLTIPGRGEGIYIVRMLTFSGNLMPIEVIVAFVCLVDERLDW